MSKSLRMTGGVVLAGLLAASVAPSAAEPPAGDASVARGSYLAAILGCGECHTPMKMGTRGPEPDAARSSRAIRRS